jgi:amino acid permease
LRSGLFGFLFAMWILILVGGGIVVTILGPITISGFGELDWIIGSSIKAIVAIALVILWIVILSKLKNWIFRKDIAS